MYPCHGLRMGFPQTMSPCWAPWWVGSMGGETLHTNMASQKKAKLNESKRPLSDSDSETETPNPSSIPNSFNSPRFIVIQSQDPSKPVTKLSPFIIEKQLSSILGTPKSVKKLKDQTILVECLSNQQASNLLKHTKFFDLNVKIFPHPSLNSCKGVIRCRELNFCNSLQEIKDSLKQQGVTDVRRISVRRDGEQKLTNTYILTFSSPVLPISIKIGFQIVKVDVYVPNPLRCFRCQRYGHHISKFPNEETCSKCAHQGPDHDSSTCSNPLHCINCKAAHSTFSRECPAWREEKEVLSIKYNNNVSFPDARKLFEQRKKTSSGPSYAGVVGSSSEKDDCSTCKILAKILLQKFPDVATELKELLPASTLSKLIPGSSSASKTNKPSSAQSKPTNPQSTSSQKTSKPSTSSQNIPPQKTSKPSPSSQQKPQTSSSQSSTKVSQKENNPNTPKPAKRSSSRTKPQPRDAPRSRETTVKKDDPVPTSNRFSELEDMDADVEKLEDEASDSEASIWSVPKDTWNKDTDDWSSSLPETKLVPY